MEEYPGRTVVKAAANYIGLEPVERERAPQRHHDAEYDFLQLA